MRLFTMIAALTTCLAASTWSQAGPLATRPTLTLEGAQTALAAALDEARRLNAGGCIAVVDDGGHLVAFARIEGTFAAGADVSIGKARTAATFRKPTRAFEDSINNGRTAMAAVHFTPLQGGVPIVVDGQVVGAVGVSGAASAQQDDDIARVAALALDTDRAAQH